MSQSATGGAETGAAARACSHERHKQRLISRFGCHNLRQVVLKQALLHAPAIIKGTSSNQSAGWNLK
jgi:hypothetical protein